MITERIYEQKETKAVKALRNQVSSEFIFVSFACSRKPSELSSIINKRFANYRALPIGVIHEIGGQTLFQLFLAELLETRIPV